VRDLWVVERQYRGYQPVPGTLPYNEPSFPLSGLETTRPKNPFLVNTSVGSQ